MSHAAQYLPVYVTPDSKIKDYSPLLFLDQARYVTEALRHLFSAQKAAAIESRDTAKKLSLQQQVGGVQSKLKAQHTHTHTRTHASKHAHTHTHIHAHTHTKHLTNKAIPA